MFRRKKNVFEICRLCAGETKNGIVIYSSEGLELCLDKKINQCLQIEVSKSDRLPKKICYSCQRRLEESHRFLEETNRVQKTLKLLIEINGVKSQFYNDPKIQKVIELEDGFGIKEEIRDFPLDVVVETENNGKIKSLNLSHCASYVTDKESLESYEIKGTNVIDENSSLQFLQNSRTASPLPLKSEEGEKDDNQVIENKTIVSCSLTNNESQEIDVKERENFSETEEEDEGSDKNTKEWKKQWGIKCIKCHETFLYRSQFDKHYKNDHDKDPVYTCSYCNKTVEKYSTFRSHCYRHVTEGRYRCEQCEKGFGLRGALHVHVQAKHNDTRKTFMCEQCGKSFATRPGLNTHLLMHGTHELSPKEFPCADCGKV